jgi:hypothetical protein
LNGNFPTVKKINIQIFDFTILTLQILLFKKQEREIVAWFGNDGFAERIKHPIYVTHYP